MTVCPCNPEKQYEECCGPYLNGEKLPPSAEELMRSRYTAYVQENYDYVIRTCHVSTRPEEKDFEESVSIDWTGLEIVDTEAGREGDSEGVVEFIARYTSSGMNFNQHERSTFVHEDGQWYYVDGELVKPPQAKSDKIGRNTPCPCGSGKKYKKCCLRKEQA